MKTLIDYVDEAFRINKDTKINNYYNYHPKTKEELKKIIKELLHERGNNADLNDIDVSNITDMSFLFYGSKISSIDITDWNVSNVTNMDSMFYRCLYFNCDLSNWNVSSVKHMSHMFYRCENFNCDLSNWNVSSVMDMYGMFDDCYNLQKIPSWYK